MIKRIVKDFLPYGLVTRIQKAKRKKALIEKQRVKQERLNALSSKKPLYLELGSGDKKGTGNWLTMDLNIHCDIPCNLLEKIPLPAESVSKIYSSHFLEHFHTKDIIKILQECHRVMEPGGWISACVPDGSIYIKAYANGLQLDPQKWLRYKPAATIFTDIDIVNYMAYMDDEHKHLFDIDNLCALFKNAGFKEVKPRTLIEGLDLEVRDYQSIYVEAIK